VADIVFVLGAGASVHANAPVMATFLDVARNLLLTGKAGNYRADFETVFKAIGLLQIAQAKSDLDLYNIESVFTAFEMVELVRPDFFRERGIDTDPASALKRLIAHTLEQEMRFPTSNGFVIGPTQYTNLAKLLERFRSNAVPPRSCAVLTFNYDVGLDMACARERLQYRYFLDGESDQGQSGAVPLLKLHGSLNWFERLGGGIHAIRLESVADRFGRGTRDACLIHVSQLAGDANCCPEVERGTEPFLVPPMLNKGEKHRTISSVWRQAAKELSEARSIFVIGYSMPNADIFFKHLFAIGTIGDDPFDRIQLFDPDAHRIESRYRELLGRGGERRFEAVPCTFDVALLKIANLFRFN
jgi:hypothetical protein